MCQSIAHLICERQGQLGTGGREVGIMFLDVVAGFAEDFQISNDGVLYQFILQESDFIHVLGLAVNSLDCLQNVRQIIDQTLPILAHIGTA